VQTLILGLGNPLLRDDGLGIYAAREIKRLVSSLSVDVKESSHGGLGIIELIQGYKKVVIVDALRTPGAKPGEIKRLSIDDLPKTTRLFSPHDIDLKSAVLLAKRLKIKLPSEIVIWGIEIEDAFTFGEELTKKVKEALPKLIQAVLKECKG
jgi:hydrogenase maturation protease